MGYKATFLWMFKHQVPVRWEFDTITPVQQKCQASSVLRWSDHNYTGCEYRSNSSPPWAESEYLHAWPYRLELHVGQSGREHIKQSDSPKTKNSLCIFSLNDDANTLDRKPCCFSFCLSRDLSSDVHGLLFVLAQHIYITIEYSRFVFNFEAKSAQEQWPSL